MSRFSMDSSFSVEPPSVSARSREIYKLYVTRGKQGAGSPSKQDLKVYQHYVTEKTFS